MQLHTIKLPIATNDGASYGEALAGFENDALVLAGGYTSLPLQQGAWRDPKSGTVYKEWVQPYEVACDADTWADLVNCAFRLFPDQLAIFTADLGTADILERP